MLNKLLKRCGANLECLLVNVSPIYEYVDGKRTEKVTGFRYEVVLPELDFDKCQVRIEGSQQMEKPDKPTPVKFDGLEFGYYMSGNKPQVFAKAAGVHVAKQ